MARSKTILVLGSLNIDLVTTTSRLPVGGETLTATSFSTGPGGKGANQAVACARLSRSKAGVGLRTASSNATASARMSSSEVGDTAEDVAGAITVKMLGAVGCDEFGPQLISSLIASGVDTSGIRKVRDTNTGVAVILVEEVSGENRILLSPGANFTLSQAQFLSTQSLGTPLPDLIILQLEIPLRTVLQVMGIAKSAEIPVLLNPAPAVALPDEVFAGLAHLVVNESEAALLTGRATSELEEPNFVWSTILDEFISKGVKSVVVTLGSKGATFATKEGVRGYVPAARVSRLVDTTAAGDTFVGAYAVGTVRDQMGKEDIVKWACMAAARTVERRGAQSAIPWGDEVEKTSCAAGAD